MKIPTQSDLAGLGFGGSFRRGAELGLGTETGAGRGQLQRSGAEAVRPVKRAVIC